MSLFAALYTPSSEHCADFIEIIHMHVMRIHPSYPDLLAAFLLTWEPIAMPGP
jgi:hypothetical protein